MASGSPQEVRYRRFTVDDYHRMIELGILTEYHPVELMSGEVTMKADWRSPHLQGTALSERYRFTRDEYLRLLEAGIVRTHDRIELYRGEATAVPPISSHQSACSRRLMRLFGPQPERPVLMSVRDPIQLSECEPEPDFTLLAFRDDYYARRKPTSKDVILIVEVSSFTLNHARRVRAPLFARNGITEFWIVDLGAIAVLTHRGPQSDGTWATSETHHRGDTLTIATLPDVSVAVADILP